MTTALVTGATGTVGSAVVARAARARRRGPGVRPRPRPGGRRPLRRRRARRRRLRGPGVDPARAGGCRRRLPRLRQRPGPGALRDAAIDAAAAAGVRRIVKLSALGARGRLAAGVLGLAGPHRAAARAVRRARRGAAARELHVEPARLRRRDRAHRHAVRPGGRRAGGDGRPARRRAAAAVVLTEDGHDGPDLHAHRPRGAQLRGDRRGAVGCRRPRDRVRRRRRRGRAAGMLEAGLPPVRRRLPHRRCSERCGPAPTRRRPHRPRRSPAASRAAWRRSRATTRPRSAAWRCAEPRGGTSTASG